MDCNEHMRPSGYSYNSACHRRLLTLLLAVILPCLATVAAGAEPSGNTLQSIHVSPLGGQRAQIELVLAKPPHKPSTFTIDNPARIALDFPATQSDVKHKTRPISIGPARRITAVQADGRTRVVLDLTEMVPFNVQVKGKSVFVTLNSQVAATTDAPFTLSPAAKANAKSDSASNEVQGVDFRRGPSGEGRIVVKLSNPQTPIDMRQEDGKIVVDFLNTHVPKKFVKRYDVVDFATPVHTVDLFQSDSSARMVVDAKAPFDKLAYQTKNAFTLEVKHVSKKQQEAEKKKEFGYTGKKLSLNFQNIEVRAALQIIADFTGLNLVTSDSVSGNLTLRLQNVPWDQALDIILKSKGLAMRKTDNVILVAPAAEIAAHEKQELESKKQVQALAPLHSELIQINYAKAKNIAKILQAKSNSFLSKRGNVTIDDRTNTLLIQDTDDKLTEIRKLVSKLDVPVRQVLIQSRIVIANNDFSRDLGVRFGNTYAQKFGNGNVVSTTGTSAGNDTMVNSNGNGSLLGPGASTPLSLPSQSSRYNVDLPVVNSNAANVAFAVLSKNYLLDLELSALQAEGRGEVISSPRVITANQRQAEIKQGVEIPYQQATSSGATSVSFKEATLSLKVTPQITPDDRIVMDLKVTKDTVGQVFLGVPSINTRQIATQVLVDNGQTVVLGGIFEHTNTNNVNSVPFFGSIPGLGYLFRSNNKVNNKDELLVFVTPKILKQSLSQVDQQMQQE